jgi:hypothetical protein
MDNDITSGANREEVLAYAERLDSYVKDNIIEPLINELGNIFSLALYYYWCSNVAVAFRNTTVLGTKDCVKKILNYEHVIRNNVFSAYNFWAAANSNGDEGPALIRYDDAGAGCDVYESDIETRIVELRAVNGVGSFGMNKAQINSIVLPKLSTLKNDLEAAFQGIPIMQGLFDTESAQSSAYETNLAVMRASAINLVQGTLNMVEDKIKEEQDNSTLAQTQAADVLRG